MASASAPMTHYVGSRKSKQKDSEPEPKRPKKGDKK